MLLVGVGIGSLIVASALGMAFRFLVLIPATLILIVIALLSATVVHGRGHAGSLGRSTSRIPRGCRCANARGPLDKALPSDDEGSASLMIVHRRGRLTRYPIIDRTATATMPRPLRRGTLIRSGSPFSPLGMPR
jgi:hypothetical protein